VSPASSPRLPLFHAFAPGGRRRVMPPTLLALYLLLALGPVLFLIWEGFAGPARIAFGTRHLTLLLKSVAYAASVSGLTLSLALPAAALLWRLSGKKALVSRIAALSTLAVPPYIHAFAWNAALGLPAGTAGGWLLAVWVQSMAMLPLALGVCTVGLDSVRRDYFEAARVARSDTSAFIGVVLPLAGPYLTTAALLVLILSLTDYTVPSLYQVPVYALELFADFSSAHQPAGTLLLALPLLLVTLPAAVGALVKLRRVPAEGAHAGLQWRVAPRPATWQQTLERLAAIVVALQVGVPLVMLCLTTGSPSQAWQTLAAGGRELLFTGTVALAAALLALPLALVAADRLGTGGSAAWLWWPLVLAPVAVPAPLVAVGLIQLWWIPLPQALPVLADLARFLPLAALLLYGQLQRLDRDLVDAARLHDLRPLRTWWRIYLPMLGPGLAAAGVLVFALALGELGASLMVAAPGHATVSMRIYGYLHYGAHEAVAGLALGLTVLTVAGTVLALLGLRAGARRGQRPMGVPA
jgi:iron(III) transport system permease protein